MALGKAWPDWVALVLAGIAVVGGLSLLIGASAPRWPSGWLERDRGPLRLLPGDSQQRYRRLGAVWLKSFLPEAGALFGGKTKKRLPRLDDRAAVEGYLREVRRGEWVHWLSDLTWLPLVLFQPWGLALVFAILTLTVNGAAIVVLRYNRVRLYGVLADLT